MMWIWMRIYESSPCVPLMNLTRGMRRHSALRVSPGVVGTVARSSCQKADVSHSELRLRNTSAILTKTAKKSFEDAMAMRAVGSRWRM